MVAVLRRGWLLVVLLLGTARAERDWPIGETARTLPRSTRCALVREVFSPNAFDELHRYVNGGTGCGMRARVAGRVQVTALVKSQKPADAKTGLEPVEWLFAANEKCSGKEFDVLGPQELSHTADHPMWLQLSLIPLRKDELRFGVGGGVPNGTAGCASVAGEARRRGDKWTLTPARDATFDFSVISEGSYAAGQPIPLHCKFTNLTSSTQTVRLPGRQSGAPAFMRARAWNDRGALLTKSNGSPDGWWSVHVLDSHFYQEAPGDSVEVEAGHDLLVDVDLSMILRGSRLFRTGSLRPGRYRVQLDSEAGPSNEITIEVTSSR